MKRMTHNEVLVVGFEGTHRNDVVRATPVLLSGEKYWNPVSGAEFDSDRFEELIEAGHITRLESRLCLTQDEASEQLVVAVYRSDSRFDFILDASDERALSRQYITSFVSGDFVVHVFDAEGADWYFKMVSKKLVSLSMAAMEVAASIDPDLASPWLG